MKEKWTLPDKISVVAACISVIGAVASIGVGWYLHNDDQRFQRNMDVANRGFHRAMETPLLIVNSSNLEPALERPCPTNVIVRNEGKREAVIERVDFVHREILETPESEKLVGALPTIPVLFQLANYQEHKRQFSVTLDEPIEVPGDIVKSCVRAVGGFFPQAAALGCLTPSTKGIP